MKRVRATLSTEEKKHGIPSFLGANQPSSGPVQSMQLTGGPGGVFHDGKTHETNERHLEMAEGKQAETRIDPFGLVREHHIDNLR